MLLCIRLIDPPLRPEQGVASSGLRTQGAYQRVHAWRRVASSIVVTRASVHPGAWPGRTNQERWGVLAPHRGLLTPGSYAVAPRERHVFIRRWSMAPVLLSSISSVPLGVRMAKRDRPCTDACWSRSMARW